jgi:hypothetical protein
MLRNSSRLPQAPAVASPLVSDGTQLESGGRVNLVLCLERANRPVSVLNINEINIPFLFSDPAAWEFSRHCSV